MKDLCTRAYSFIRSQEKGVSGEESKEAEELNDAEKAKLAKQIDQVVDSLTQKKAAPKAGGLRSFMKT